MKIQRALLVSFTLSILATCLFLGLRQLGNGDGDFEENYYRHLQLLDNNYRFLSESERQTFLDDYPQYTNTSQNNICTGGKDPDSMTTSDYLKAFAEGPCATFLGIGGLASSLLEIQIDCETLRDKRPDIFEDCGWTRCSWSVFGGAPKPEYRLWIPSNTGPLNVYSKDGKSATCFTWLFYLEFDKTKTGREAFSNVDGVNVTWHGNTPETAKKSECGLIALGEMIEVPVVKLPRVVASWIFMNTHLRYMGYRSGLTMQMLPYDFRYPLQYNDASFTFLRALKMLNALTGKKAVIAGHSLGVESTVYFTSLLSQADKEKYISSGIGIGGPMDGAGEAIPLLFGGKLIDMTLFGVRFGLRFNDTMRFTETLNTGLQMLPGDSWYR